MYIVNSHFNPLEAKVMPVQLLQMYCKFAPAKDKKNILKLPDYFQVDIYGGSMK